MIHLPQSIQWGIANEDNARHAYIAHMQAEGHTNLQVEPCGFIIHPTMGWLGASPDGVVNDSSNNPSLGIVEFKCPLHNVIIYPKKPALTQHFTVH